MSDSIGEDEEEYRRLSELDELLSESLLAIRIQLLNVGDSESRSSELAESRFLLLDLVVDSKARPGNSVGAAARERRDPDDDDDEFFGADEDEGRDVRCDLLLLLLLLLLPVEAAVEGLGLTPFSNKCSGHGFWIACAIS